MQVPLRFVFSELIMGRGFIARVETIGSALFTDESGDPWIHGVKPGCFAGGGPTSGDAFWSFHLGYRSVLYDLANDCMTFEELEQRIHAFANSVNEPYETEYKDSLTKVQREEMEALELVSMSEQTLSPSTTVTLVSVHEATPTANALPSYFASFLS